MAPPLARAPTTEAGKLPLAADIHRIATLPNLLVEPTRAFRFSATSFCVPTLRDRGCRPVRGLDGQI